MRALPDFVRFNLIGESPAFRHALAVVPRIADSDATVLVQGETGTGKELVAHAIHSGQRGPMEIEELLKDPSAAVATELQRMLAEERRIRRRRQTKALDAAVAAFGKRATSSGHALGT